MSTKVFMEIKFYITVNMGIDISVMILNKQKYNVPLPDAESRRSVPEIPGKVKQQPKFTFNITGYTKLEHISN